MTALAANARRDRSQDPADINHCPVNAGSKIYVGSIVVREAATGVVVPATDAAGVVPLGVAVAARLPDDPDLAIDAAYDNTDGADGTITGSTKARCVDVDGAGLWAFATTGTPKVGAPAYISDDNTVQVAANTYGAIIGVFVRPAPRSGQWLVDITKRRGAAVAPLTEAAGAIGGTNDGDLPDLTATYVARTGQTGTANGAYEAIGATNGGDVSGAIANNIRELDTVVQQLAADNVALRAAVRELAAKVNAILAR